MQPLSLTSRADLLRQLQLYRAGGDAVLVAELLGYEVTEATIRKQRTTLPVSHSEGIDRSTQDSNIAEHEDSTTPEKIPDERFIVLHSREQYADQSSLQDGLPECLQGVDPLSETDLQPKGIGEPLIHQPLAPQQRLLPFLRNALVYPLDERLDVARLVRKVARLEVLHRIPKQAHILPAGRVYVLLDLNKRLLPFWQDAHQLCDLLARKLSRNGLDIRVLEDKPGGRYSDWFDDEQLLQDWNVLRTPAVVMIVSDLGGLARNNLQIKTSWLSFIRQLGRKSIRPIVLSPCVEQVCVDFRLHADLVPWGRASRFKKQITCRITPDLSRYVRRVLGLLSVAVHVEPVLLRAILGCLPVDEADSDVEAAVYFHEDMVWGHTAIALKAEKREEYRTVFRAEEAEIQWQVLLLIRQHHIGQFPFVWASAVLNAQPLVKFSLETLPDADIEWAEQLMRQFTRSLCGEAQDQGMVQFARRELQRLGKDDDGNVLYQQEYASALHGLAYRERLQSGSEIPDGYDAAIVKHMIRQLDEPQNYRLVQRGEYVYVEAESWEKQDDLLQIGSNVSWFESAQKFLSFKLNDGAWNTHRLLNKQALFHVNKIDQAEVDSGNERLHLLQIERPSWASELRRGYGGLQARLEFLNKTHIFYPSLSESLSGQNRINWRPSTQKLASSDKSGSGIFICYSHKDEVWKDRLMAHLKVLQQDTDVSVWNDRQIMPGDRWVDAIEKAIDHSKVAILMVSPDFLASEFISQIEVKRFLQRKQEGSLSLFPLIVRPCLWQKVPWLAELQGATKDNLPLSRFQPDSHELETELSQVAMQAFTLLRSAKEESQNQESNQQGSIHTKLLFEKKDGDCDIGWDLYGLHVDLTIQNITQRFRWIEPGTFMMGSPKDEKGRYDDEDLHQVTLTQGFWLADTTVTQELWQAIMGNTPSHFKGNSGLPVESVSWDDCNEFIQKLNKQIPGLQAKLPTEAQWEYACRAGTDTPFYFGGKDDLTQEKVNYSGKWDGIDSKGQTKLVKNYPSNSWGLYEMHGNVLEWCQDVWQENLGNKTAIDPEQQAEGEQAGVERVVRGGSWIDQGRICRSAVRLGNVPGIRDYYIGFRLSLGHELQPGAGSAGSGTTINSKEIADSGGWDSAVVEQAQSRTAEEAAGLVSRLFESGKKFFDGGKDKS